MRGCLSCVLGMLAAILGALLCSHSSPSSPEGTEGQHRPQVRLARDAPMGMDGQPGGRPHGGRELVERGGRSKRARRRRRRQSKWLANHEVPARGDPGEHALPALDVAPGLERLRPLSPLPTPYRLHLEYMAAHPVTRPDAGHQGSWFSAARGYERGRSSRDAELAAIQRQSGWDPGDSPMVTLPPPASGGYEARADKEAWRPVLTGNAWHWGEGRCPEACVANGGVCLPTVGRCDCPRHRWGASCELFVQPALARPERFHGWCVYNDSSPFFCDKPLCVRAVGEAHDGGAHAGREVCVGQPLVGCPSQCHGKGICLRGGRCACVPGYLGASCERSVPMNCIAGCHGRGECEFGFCRCRPPFYGVDCSLRPPSSHAPSGSSDAASTPSAGTAAVSAAGRPPSTGMLPRGHLGVIDFPRRSSGLQASALSPPHGSAAHASAADGRRCLRPCVYVYELPARMNVLALKAVSSAHRMACTRRTSMDLPRTFLGHFLDQRWPRLTRRVPPARRVCVCGCGCGGWVSMLQEPTWPFYEHGPADYRAFKAVHLSLLRSAHRTADPTHADYFYVPTWDFHGSWGNPEIYWRAQRYIASTWPFWNRTRGADHIWTITRDAGGCSSPWGSIWDQVRPVQSALLPTRAVAPRIRAAHSRRECPHCMLDLCWGRVYAFPVPAPRVRSACSRRERWRCSCDR